MRDIGGVNPASFATTESWSSLDRDTNVASVLVSRPRNIRELVAAMHAYRNRAIHPVGSGWSLSNAHEPEDVAIDLREMVRTSSSIGDDASSYLRSEIRDDGRTFFALRGGARLHQIVGALWNRGFSFPTLGGSHGQTLAGALSTGTHGGDYAYSSVNDAVHALHVVVPGGKEYWIEPRINGGVTDHQRLRTDYADWDDDIEILAHDDAFAACLIGCGRLGIIHAALVEVVPRFYQEQETLWESWKPDPHKKSVENALRQVVAGRSWDRPLFRGSAPFTPSVHDLSFLEIHYDPKGPSAYVRRRWRSDQPQPLLPRPSGPSPECFGFIQFLANIPLPIIVPDIFAEQHRNSYAQVLTDGMMIDRTLFRDVGHQINVGTLPSGKTWTQIYDDAVRNSILVESFELFFDAMDDAYLDFVDAVHDQDWGTIAGGYIALRYTRTRTRALLGVARFAQTVAVEVTIIKGFQDGGGTHGNVTERVKRDRILAHWGQENPHSAPAIDRMFGQEIRRWREMIPFLLGPHAASPSNRFTRQKGLEYGPGLRVADGNRTLCWLGYNEDRTSTLFHRGFTAPNPSATALRFVRTDGGGRRDIALAIESDGNVQAQPSRLPSPATSASIPPGSLVMRREGKVMAVVTPRGNGFGLIQHDRWEELPLWTTRA